MLPINFQPFLIAFVIITGTKCQNGTDVVPFDIFEGVTMGHNFTYEISYVDQFFALPAGVSSLDEAKAACRSKGGSQLALFRSNSQFHVVMRKMGKLSFLPY